MIWQIDTSKIPDKDITFLAEVILLSAKSNCTIDKSIELMKDLLRNKK